MRKAFKPRDYQHLAIEHMLAHLRCAVWAGLGMGKTVSTLIALAMLKALGGAGITLVVAPLRVARNTWPKEALEWDVLESLVVRSIVGATPAKRAKLFKAALAEGADVVCINYESLPWLVEHLASLGTPWPFKTVVADESTKLKGFRPRQGAKRPALLYKMSARSGTRFIQLTGTPSPQGLMDLFGQMYFLDGGARLGRTFGVFTETHFHEKQMEGGYSIYTVRSGALDRAMAACKDVCLTLMPEDYMTLDKPRISTVYVDLPDDVRRVYDELETEFITEVAGIGIRALNSATLQGKLLQVCSGAMYKAVGSAAYIEMHDEKLDALESIMEELGGEQLLVVFEFKSDLARLQKRFPKARRLRTQQDEDDWNAGKIDGGMMLIHPQSAGHGVNLQHGGRNICWFSHSFNLETFEQVRERLGVVRQHQAGYKRIVNEFYIVARDTVDEICIAKRDKKAVTQQSILAYAKVKNRLPSPAAV